MSGIALVTGADRGLGIGIVKGLLKRGWTVYAGKYIDWHELPDLQADFPELLKIVSLDVASDDSVNQVAAELTREIDHLDLLISNAGLQKSHLIQNILDKKLNFDNMQSEFNTNSLGLLRLVRALYDLLEKSALKRICVVSSEAGSNAASDRTGWFGYCMSKSAVNMATRILWNDMHPKGFDFRLYHPGWVRSYMHGEKNTEARFEPEEAGELALNCFLSNDIPDRLFMTDFEGKEWPW